MMACMASATSRVPTASLTMSPSTMTYSYPVGTGPRRLTSTGGTGWTTTVLGSGRPITYRFLYWPGGRQSLFFLASPGGQFPRP